jgi:hypothetical protein
MPISDSESRPPEEIATQIGVGRWLVDASAGLTAALSSKVPDTSQREALDNLATILRLAAERESIVAISGDLGLVSDRDAACLIDAAGDVEASALRRMADVVADAVRGTAKADDEAITAVRRLLLALSSLRLAQARHVDRADPADFRWPTTLSSVS